MNLRKEDIVLFISNIIAESEGKITLEKLAPHETYKTAFPINEVYGYTDSLFNSFLIKKHFAFELNYLKYGKSVIDNWKTKEEKIEFGRLFYLDKASIIGISNF
jgi:hypothetical protein